jgi:hypothetical protein
LLERTGQQRKPLATLVRSKAKEHHMRDFRDAKAMARTLRAALAAKGLKISHSDSLELIAKALGARDWNTLSAMIHAEPPARPADLPPPADTVQAPPAARGSATFSGALEETLHRAVRLANERRHEYTTPEHLLLALTNDHDAAKVLSACAVSLELLRNELVDDLGGDLHAVRGDNTEQAAPSAGFQRIIQRAIIHVRSSGLGSVSGANVLIALFSERESRAFKLLSEQRMTRLDAVSFVAHGVRKGDGNAAA